MYLPEGGIATATVTLNFGLNATGIIEFITAVPQLGQEAGFNLNTITNASLSLTSYSFASSTNTTLELNNLEAFSISPTSYTVGDGAGDEYILNFSYPGPNCCPASAVTPLVVLIGTSCPTCKLNGNPFTFVTGNSYTVTLLTSLSYEFVYTIKR